jgi:hypothetical protein
MHNFMHIYVSYAMLNNIFAHLNRLSHNIARGYQLIPFKGKHHSTARRYIYQKFTNIIADVQELIFKCRFMEKCFV